MPPEITPPQRNINQLPLRETTAAVLQEIDGHRIESNLINLAKIGGTRIEGTHELPEKYAVNRLALTPNDLAARPLIAGEMEEAGMEVREHPLGLMGIYPGSNPNLPAIAMISHTDSVPNAGMYDGTVGVISAIEIVKTLHKHNIQFPHPIMVLSLTGEESARFNMALFGSRGIFQGFTDAELAAKKPGDVSLAQAIKDAGFDPETLRKPSLGLNGIAAAVELHVAQDDTLTEGIGVVEAIAAPVRYQVTIGETPLQPDTKDYPNAKYVKLHVKGKVGHSGATPMGAEFRADGLVALADVLSGLPMMKGNGENKVSLAIGNVVIADEALNKIPGNTEVLLRLNEGNADACALDSLKEYVAEKK